MQSSPVLGENLLTLGIFGFASGTLFSLITLPVEFDASKRAIYWLERKRIVNQRELSSIKRGLKLGCWNICGCGSSFNCKPCIYLDEVWQKRLN